MMARGKLGIYSDDVFWLERGPDGLRISADQAFLLFACAVGERYGGRFVLFGRTREASIPAAHVLPASAELAELPYYDNLRRVGQVLRVGWGTLAAMWRGLERVDTLWVLGPNPFGIALIALGMLRGKRVTLGVRQDTLRYYRSRMPDRRWGAALPLVWAMDRFYRLLARHRPTTVVGEDLARGYAGTHHPVLPMKVTLIGANDVATDIPAPPAAGQLQLLTVGRIDREKNPLLLVDALARLEHEQPGRYRLRWVGSGPLEEAVRARARQLAVLNRLDLCGYVPYGPHLLAAYRHADIFVHVSLTEGVPQVVLEALACAAPIVATDVGGVREALDGGRAGLLVPPSDLDALVRAIQRVAGDERLRARLILRGLELARTTTIEVESERVAGFLAGCDQWVRPAEQSRG